MGGRGKNTSSSSRRSSERLKAKSKSTSSMEKVDEEDYSPSSASSAKGEESFNSSQQLEQAFKDIQARQAAFFEYDEGIDMREDEYEIDDYSEICSAPSLDRYLKGARLEGVLDSIRAMGLDPNDPRLGLPTNRKTPNSPEKNAGNAHGYPGTIVQHNSTSPSSEAREELQNSQQKSGQRTGPLHVNQGEDSSGQGSLLASGEHTTPHEAQNIPTLTQIASNTIEIKSAENNLHVDQIMGKHSNSLGSTQNSSHAPTIEPSDKSSTIAAIVVDYSNGIHAGQQQNPMTLNEDIDPTCQIIPANKAYSQLENSEDTHDGTLADCISLSAHGLISGKDTHIEQTRNASGPHVEPQVTFDFQIATNSTLADPQLENRSPCHDESLPCDDNSSFLTSPLTNIQQQTFSSHHPPAHGPAPIGSVFTNGQQSNRDGSSSHILHQNSSQTDIHNLGSVGDPFGQNSPTPFNNGLFADLQKEFPPLQNASTKSIDSTMDRGSNYRSVWGQNGTNATNLATNNWQEHFLGELNNSLKLNYVDGFKIKDGRKIAVPPANVFQEGSLH